MSNGKTMYVLRDDYKKGEESHPISPFILRDGTILRNLQNLFKGL